MHKPAAWALSVAIAACAMLSPSAAPAQDRPLRIIAPLAAGSTFDLLARAVGSRFDERTGRTVVVENRVGANMGIAATACKSAAPDGQTICLFTHNLFLNPLINSKLNYDPVKDLAPIALLSYLEQVLVVSRRVPVVDLCGTGTLREGSPGHTELRIGRRRLRRSCRGRMAAQEFRQRLEARAIQRGAPGPGRDGRRRRAPHVHARPAMSWAGSRAAI